MTDTEQQIDQLRRRLGWEAVEIECRFSGCAGGLKILAVRAGFGSGFGLMSQRRLLGQSRTAGYSVNTGYLLTSSNEIVIQYPVLMNIPTFRPFIHKAGVTPGQSGAGSHSYPRHGYPVPTFVITT